MSFRDIVASYKIKQIRNRMEPADIQFPHALKSPKHILICLPGNLRELTLVKQLLPNITDLFKPADIVLLSMPGIKVNDIFPRKGFQILSPSPEQITWSGLAKKAYIDTIKGLKIDLLLDLNLEASHFTSSILLNFPDAIRVGRGNHRGNPFYNLEIKTKYLRDEKNIYRSMLETLSVLKNITTH
jgi:hypothetical protein